MPLDTVADNSPTNFPTPDFLTLGNFSRGVITLIDKSRLPKNALEEATNLFLVEDGQPSNRPGVGWFGTTPFIPSPTAPTLTKATGTTLGIGVYKYVVTFVNAQGETLAGTEASVTTSTGTTNVNLTAIPVGVGGTVSRKIYRTSVGGAAGSEKFLHTIADNTTTTYTDNTADASLGASFPLTGTAEVGEFDGFDYFDNGGTIHLVAAADGNILRSLDNGGTWSFCTGETFTAGSKVKFNQYNSFLYITTEVGDPIGRYDGTTTLQEYVSLSTPIAPTIVGTGLTGTAFTYFYKISAVSQIGFSIASPSGTIQTSTSRDNWDKTTEFLTLTLPTAQTTQTRVDIYISTDDLNYYYLDSVTSTNANPTLTYRDNGTAIIVPSTTAPTDNTTQGPSVAELVNVGNRMYGVRDPNNRYRIWFTSGQQPLGAFSSGYDGGYLDWQLGGKYIPQKVADYRDGKGTPLATVWCSSADGQGCILQMSLDTLTVGNLSVTVPSAYKLPGSRGTPSPDSVINVLNDYMFYNTQAFYNLGSRPQLLQILSTDEVSANIRPTVKTISHTAEKGICSAYSDAKVYFSVPYNSDVNNFTAVFDTERKAWLPTAFDIGFKQFLKYTDTAGGQHLLALKPGDNQLSEIADNIAGDYGEAIQTNLLTGLYPVMKDRYDFQFVEEMEYEFSNPDSTINVELLGIDHSKGFVSEVIVPLNIQSSVVETGWDTVAWDTDVWDDTSVVPTTVSESSYKRYTPVQKEMNAIQWHIFTNDLLSKYVLRSLQSWGTPSNDAHPSGWRAKAL